MKTFRFLAGAVALAVCATGMASADGAARFLGGGYDGYAQAEWMPTAIPTLAFRFHGGNFDGHAQADEVATDLLTLTPRFRGGGYDGFGATVLAPTPLPPLRARFSGGAYDGHHGLGVPIYRFEITSAHGAASPPPGMYIRSQGAALTNAVTAEDLMGATQYLARGWIMAGHAPGSGETLLCVLTITNDAALTWLWDTNYWLATAATLHGNVTPSSGWQSVGSNVPLSALPADYCHLVLWSGDVPPGNESNLTFNLPMDRAKSLTASFAQTLAALGTPHGWLAGHGLTNGGLTFDQAETDNPDADPHITWKEWIADTDPTNPASYFRVLAISNLPPTTLYFLSSSNRFYTMVGCSVLADDAWTNIPDAGPRRGEGGGDSMTDTNALPARFYRVNVRLP